MTVKTVSHPNILTYVVDIKKAPFVAYTSVDQTVKCISLQNHAMSTNTSVSGDLTGYNDSLHQTVMF